MARVNRYDVPAQADFMNTYVPIPFDQMMKIGLMKQAMVEERDKLTDETLGALQNIKVAPADEPAYLDKAAKIKSEINDIINTSAPGSYEGKRRLMSLRNQLSTDPELRSMVQNYGVYSDALTQLQEAEKDNIPANVLPLRGLVTDLSAGGKGTLGRMKETGASGIYNRGTWSKYVDVNKAMEQRINDVPESSFEQAGLVMKDGNKYIIEQGSASRSLNALGAPLGIRFTTNEKGEQTIDLSNSNIDIFLATPEGKQLQNVAIERVQNGQAKDYATEVQRQYYTHALAAIRERVSSKSTVRMAADPFDEARYRKELEDKVNPWSTPTSIATSASKLTSFNKTEEAKNTISNQITELEKGFDTTISQGGITPTVKETKDGQTYKVYLDRNGVDVSEAINAKQAEIEQLRNQRDAITSKVERIKGNLGIPSTWKINPEVEREAEAERSGAEFSFLSKVVKTPENEAIAKEIGQNAYEKYIQRKDPTWNKLNSALKADAAKSSVITSATKFGSKELNERALQEFPLLMENEVQDVGTKKTYSVKEKERLGIVYGGKTGAYDPSKIIFGGNLTDPESQKIKFIYQVYDKKGRLSDPFMVDAPAGVVDDLIKSGATTQAKQIIHQQMTLLETNPDKITQVTLGTGERTKGIVRKIQPSEMPLRTGGDQYTLTINMTGSDGVERPTEKPFPDRTSLIDYYEAFVIAELRKRK